MVDLARAVATDGAAGAAASRPVQVPIVPATQTIVDLARTPVRALNAFLHGDLSAVERVRVLHPDGAHSIAVGIDAPVAVEIDGHAGYYAAGMNCRAHVTIAGNAGPGVAENMMSGRVDVRGFASVGAGATAHGGLLVIGGDAGLRCGISLKGADIVVGGSVGSFSAFMAQAGRLIVCGDAGDALGDSLYEAVIYLRGQARSLGADAEEQPMTAADFERGITLLRASWEFFDGVAARVSPELRKGPRGGGRDRDRIIRHTVRTESEDFAKQVGLRIPEGAALTPEGLHQHREAYVAAMRAYNAGEVTRRMRSWTLPFLIRHSAFHTLDHAWEMEDKDLTAEIEA